LETISLLKILSNSAVQELYCRQIIKLIKVELDNEKEVSRFDHVFMTKLLNFIDNIQDICNTLQEEAKIKIS
jgi:hypothetical protein